jgi:GNAT superfamily N-acetyltransferase
VPTQATIDHVNSFWAGYVGFPQQLLGASGTHVVSFQNPDHTGIHLFRRGDVCVVSTTRERLDDVAKLSGESPGRVFNEQFLTQAFPTATKITGPNLVAICDASDFRPSSTDDCRGLAADDPALEALRAACTPEEWDYSALNQEADEAFGCFAGGALAAAGKLHDLRGQVLSVGVLTHPNYRGQGYGTAVARAMTAYGIDAGRVMYYRALLSNQASVRIARSLGYQDYGTTLFLRLLPSEAEQRDLLRRGGVRSLNEGAG